MEYPTSAANLAIIARSPLIELGIMQFIQSLQLDYRCVFTSSSFVGLQVRLLEAAASIVVVEFDSSLDERDLMARQVLILRKQCPGLNIVVYTHCQDVATLGSLWYQGHCSLIAQHEPLEQLRQDMVLALAGNLVCSTAIKDKIDAMKTELDEGSSALTFNEHKVLAHLSAGLSLTDIATLYRRSIKTISAHKCNGMRKLGVNNDAELFQILPYKVIPAEMKRL